jgi:hypothetical protein
MCGRSRYVIADSPDQAGQASPAVIMGCPSRPWPSADVGTCQARTARKRRRAEQLVLRACGPAGVSFARAWRAVARRLAGSGPGPDGWRDRPAEAADLDSPGVQQLRLADGRAGAAGDFGWWQGLAAVSQKAKVRRPPFIMAATGQDSRRPPTRISGQITVFILL